MDLTQPPVELILRPMTPSLFGDLAGRQMNPVRLFVDPAYLSVDPAYLSVDHVLLLDDLAQLPVELTLRPMAPAPLFVDQVVDLNYSYKHNYSWI